MLTLNEKQKRKADKNGCAHEVWAAVIDVAEKVGKKPVDVFYDIAYEGVIEETLNEWCRKGHVSEGRYWWATNYIYVGKSDIIINLTKHAATRQQRDAGVVDLSEEDKQIVSDLLTFEHVPSKSAMYHRAGVLAAIAKKYAHRFASSGHGGLVVRVMIGGAPYFMSILEAAIYAQLQVPVYAFGNRVVKERTLEDGTVEKVTEFVHEGFVRP